jgi:hypothetical protein
MIFQNIQSEITARGVKPWMSQLDLIRRFLDHRVVRRFGLVLDPGSANVIEPIEAHPKEGPWPGGRMLRMIWRDQGHTATYLYWDETDGLREVTGDYLYAQLCVRPENRFEPGQVVRVVDPAWECHCAAARGRLAQVVRPARSGPLVLVDVQGWGVIGIDPDLLRDAKEFGAVAA